MSKTSSKYIMNNMIVSGPVVNSAASTAANIVSANTLSTNNIFVGATWIISSVIFTTYSTTSFLKFDEIPKGSLAERKKTDFERRLEDASDEKNVIGRVKDRISKAVYNLDRPSLLTFHRFTISVLMGHLLHKNFWCVPERISQTISYVPEFLVPASCLFLANFCNAIALDRIGISLTYTSKCGIPLVTVLIMLIQGGTQALPSIPTLLSLVPIAFGIASASWNAPTFEKFGFLAAVTSCVSQAALNVSSKQVMERTMVTGADAQRVMVTIALIITSIMSILKQTPLMRLFGQGKAQKEAALASKKHMPHPPLWLTLMAAAAYHTEYTLSFMYVKLVQPITYGTCDAIRRLLLIISGRKMFGGAPFTKLNLAGIAMALLGAFAYSITSAVK